MININNNKAVWFVTGSQHLYGKETLNKVEENSREVAGKLGKKLNVPVQILFKPIMTTDEDIYKLCQQANNDDTCIGLICWMHTFSPGQMWIRGLNSLQKPMLHLHTQFYKDLPWNEIDMDFMNLHQAAHGDREFGFINTRMKIKRAVLVGHWNDPEISSELEDWIRAALAFYESNQIKIVRFGDNMRNVAVTEGNKVSARIKFGWSVLGYGVGELVNVINQVTETQIAKLIDEYCEIYRLDKSYLHDSEKKSKLKDAAKIELGLQQFLDDGNFNAFTTTFEDLHGLQQLPGLSVQRLMEKGYGFGAEGDWKTAALIRCMKVMAQGLEGGTSFMEDYTYDLDPQGMKVLGAHMLEVCPTIAAEKPKLEVHPLSIGGKDDPARLVFSAKEGKALNATLIDLGNRFRLLVNIVNAIKPQELPKLPVARALWKPEPNLKTAAKAWILAGGAHHTCFSYSVKPIHLQYFAEMTDIEVLFINDKTDIFDFKNQIRWNDLYYQM